jgi:hypothetical protein
MGPLEGKSLLFLSTAQRREEDTLIVGMIFINCGVDGRDGLGKGHPAQGQHLASCGAATMRGGAG